ncbi:FUSC family protein [Tatumella punctata]|uniref:FUSC family protein n=1 Tax=Tatumella punctata TaxID=399969 RepID=A0ABW1VS19_9GAMM
MRGSWGEFLRRELRPLPGRGSYALRLTVTCAILILVFMTLQIPLLSVAIIVAFYASQSNVVIIKLLSVVFFFLVTLILGCVILMLKFTYDYPLLRLICSSLLFFGAMFLMRAFDKLGLAFFIVALAVIFAQTFPAMTSDSDLVIRLIMWLWVSINTSVLVTFLVNASFRQAFPGYQFRQQLANDFDDCAAQLSHYQRTGEPSGQADTTDMAKQFTGLQSLFSLACGASPVIRRNKSHWQAVMAVAIHSYYLVMLIRPLPLTGVQQQLAGELSDYLRQLADECRQADNPLAQLPPAPQPVSDNVILRRLATVCTRLAAGEEIELPEKPSGKAPLLAADAFTNPAYPQFALKTLLATLVCYLFYTAVDWDGIHTIMLSCVIVAQPGLGPTMQKTWLRVAGGLLATAFALLLIVFIQPFTTSVVGLLMMSVPVMWLSAWIAGGSERTAYAGIQIAFTFAMGFLDWFGPLYTLTELRDRAIGILLGVLVSSLVHMYLWPESDALKLRQQLSRLFKQLSQWMADDKPPQERQWVPVYQALLTTETLMDRVAAEPVYAWSYPHPELRDWPVKQTFVQAREILRLSEGYRLYGADEPDFLQHCAAALQAYSGQIADQGAAIPAVRLPGGDNPYHRPLAQAIETLPCWPEADKQHPSVLRTMKQ